MYKKEIYSVLVLLFLLSFNSLNAQLNIKVGYANGFTKAPALNKVVDDFNVKYANNLVDNLEQFKSLHGLEIGLRYRFNRVGFELSWNSMSDRSDYVGNLNGSTNTQQKYYFSMTEYSAGLENYFGKFGYGASLGLRTARMKANIQGVARKKQSLMAESGAASKFYLIFKFPGEKVGIAFKPYFQIPLKNIDISDFDSSLNLVTDPNYVSIKPNEEKFTMFGISIVLYNGRQ